MGVALRAKTILLSREGTIIALLSLRIKPNLTSCSVFAPPPSGVELSHTREFIEGNVVSPVEALAEGARAAVEDILERP